MRFEFSPLKEQQNLSKHGVDFSTAAQVFNDPFLLIVPDDRHSSPKEIRFYAIGNDGHGILTLRFTPRGEAIRIIGAGYWRKQAKYYESNKK